MSASTQTDHDLSRREEMSVSSAAMSAAPWGAAAVTGGRLLAPGGSVELINTSCPW